MARSVLGDGAVTVEGLKEARLIMKHIDVGFEETLKEQLKKVADNVMGKARDKASSLEPMARKAGESMRTGSNPKGDAWIKLGMGTFVNAHRRAPTTYKLSQIALGAEFGSTRYKQFKGWTGNGQDAGRFLYPTIRSERDHTVELVEQALQKLVDIFADKES